MTKRIGWRRIAGLLAVFIPAFAVIVAVSLWVGYRTGYEVGDRTAGRAKEYLDFEDLITANYPRRTPSHSVLRQGCFKGMAEAIGDKHTRYFNPEETRFMAGEFAGERGGIGVKLDMSGELPVVSGFTDASPAAKAGLHDHDVITMVDDRPLAGMKSVKILALITGKAGTSVKIEVRCVGHDDMEFMIVRKTIETSQVVRTDIRAEGRNFVVLKPSDFSPVAGKRFFEQLSAVTGARQGFSGLVLDLRGNPGGRVDVAMSMASAWLGRKSVVKFRYSNGYVKSQRKYFPEPDVPWPTAVLVDGDSASASEIVAGAFQDYGAARVFGTKTYGKGSGQMDFPLKDGSSLHLTVFLWLTPKGRSIDGVGLMPDVVVPAASCDACISHDAQLDAAIRWLAEQPPR
jgi:carboxyl-terminal processing protease